MEREHRSMSEAKRLVDVNPFVIALSLMREALSLLDEPEAALIQVPLRVAIETAENVLARMCEPASNATDTHSGKRP